MKKLCAALAVLVLLPLVALANVAPGTTAAAVPNEGVEVGPGQTTGYGCCFVFFMGRWYCIPC